MSVFVKKLVEKASLKKPAGFSTSLKPDDVKPQLIFHFGIPSGSFMLAYDSIQQILAISTKDGQIKLFGKSGSQALLESSEIVSSKFLVFLENQGLLLNVTVNNHIEVWDIERKCLSAVHHNEKEITSFVAMQNASYLYVGDSEGSISVLRLHEDQRYIEQMKYRIPFSTCHGMTNEAECDLAVKFILPQPTAETKRLLIIYADGVVALWEIKESKVTCTNYGLIAQTSYQDAKKVTAACWACSTGTKVAVGYNNGDVILWRVPDSKTNTHAQIAISCKLNLGYKAEKVPILKLKWFDSDGKSSRLFVLGGSDSHSPNMLQVVLLNEYTETRTIKLGLHPPEPLVDMEVTKSSIEQSKHRRDLLLLLGRSGHIYTYDDPLIERYLIQCQTKSTPSLPRETTIKLPYGDSSITVTKFITNIPCMPCSAEEDLALLEKYSLPLFPSDRSNSSSSSTFSSFSKARNMFITGHSTGAINIWDASRILFLPLASITQQSESDLSVSGIPLTALHFCSIDSHILVSGDQSGMVRIYTLKSELFAPQTNFAPFQGSSKKGSNQFIRKIKVLKVNGAVLSINTTENLKQLAVGTDQGYVSLIDIEGPSILYQNHIASEFSTGVISMHFETCSFHGFDKNVMIVATKDSSILTFEKDTGNTLTPNIVRPKKPSKALFTKILNEHGASGRGSNPTDNTSALSNPDNSASKQSVVLLCSEKAIYTYSFTHLVQGVKKVLCKKKFSSSCYFASTFGCPEVGLILLLSSGKVQIRSLPDLSLVEETSIRALTFSTSRPLSMSDITVSSSHDGDLVIVKGDLELLFVSTLLHNEAYRCLANVSHVHDKDLVTSQGLVTSPTMKEKKKGIFSSMIKENKGTKPKHRPEVEIEDFKQNLEELQAILSAGNFPTEPEAEVAEKIVAKEDSDLDIDDIEIEDIKEKPKGGYPVIAGFNTQNITNRFQTITGKWKIAKAKTDKGLRNDKMPANDENTGAIDQIKKKYGYTSTTNEEAGAAKAKLSENLNKLQNISVKTTEMQDTARSFSSLAKQVLRFAENDKS